MYSNLKKELIDRDTNELKVGLSDYFIWHDNYDARMVTKNELDGVKGP